MIRNISNFFFGALDYLLYPAAVFAATPLMLHALGTDAYGIWSMSMAVISTGSILAAGFGDANIRHVSEARGSGDVSEAVSAVRLLLGLNILFAMVAVVIILLCAPLAAQRLVASHAELRQSCLLSLRLTAPLVALRTLESVAISTQRAFERYGAAVRISIAARVLSLAGGTAICQRFHSVPSMLIFAIACNAVGTYVQLRHLAPLLGVSRLRPSFVFKGAEGFLSFGGYSWLLAASGVIFLQADRLFWGLWGGAQQLAGYALCTQLAQPIYGFVASGLHFFFPHLSRRIAIEGTGGIHRLLLPAAAWNTLLVLTGMLAVVLLGPAALHWVTRGSVPGITRALLFTVAFSTALVGFSVTPTYALFALGRVRDVVVIQVFAAVLNIAVAASSVRAYGLTAILWGRIAYGATCCCLYLVLLHAIRRPALLSRKSPCEAA